MTSEDAHPRRGKRATLGRTTAHSVSSRPLTISCRAHGRVACPARCGQRSGRAALVCEGLAGRPPPMAAPRRSDAPSAAPHPRCLSEGPKHRRSKPPAEPERRVPEWGHDRFPPTPGGRGRGVLTLDLRTGAAAVGTRTQTRWECRAGGRQVPPPPCAGPRPAPGPTVRQGTCSPSTVW